jgi:C-terminal processing protease CtpA/Prc
MKSSRQFRWLLPVLFASVLLLASTGSGWFGLAISVDGSGVFWNPTVTSITFTEVVPDSPAAREQLSAGDLILEMEGLPVVGAKGSLLRSKLKREIGEPLHLKLQRKSGEAYFATLRAAKKP